MNRRKFFGVAAATSAVAATGGRSFARTLDRSEKPVITAYEGSSAVTFRLYYKGKVVHEQRSFLTVEKDGTAVRYGVGQDVVMENFIGHTDDCTIELAGVPHEAAVGFGNYPLPIGVSDGDTLTVQADPVKGFLEVT